MVNGGEGVLLRWLAMTAEKAERLTRLVTVCARQTPACCINAIPLPINPTEARVRSPLNARLVGTSVECFFDACSSESPATWVAILHLPGPSPSSCPRYIAPHRVAPQLGDGHARLKPSANLVDCFTCRLPLSGFRSTSPSLRIFAGTIPQSWHRVDREHAPVHIFRNLYSTLVGQFMFSSLAKNKYALPTPKAFKCAGDSID
jgi:hypothetical protein